jgi:hypothetical protein
MDGSIGLLFVGDDWAEEHHDVELQNETGRVLGRAKLPEGVAGIARLHAMLGEHVGDDDEPATARFQPPLTPTISETCPPGEGVSTSV